MRLSALVAMPRLLVAPAAALFHAPIRVTGEGAAPHSTVRLTNEVSLPGVGRFRAAASFRVDGDGRLDLAAQPPLEGSDYAGRDAMGLFNALRAAPEERPGTRCTPKDPRVPFRHKLTLTTESGETATAEVERTFIHPSIERIEIEEGRIRGSLYRPKGLVGQMPAVLDLFGTGGGLMEHRAALLASEGFVTFSLAFVNYKDLPKDFGDPIDLSYFVEAAEWLASHPNVCPGGVGMIGTSLGATIAYLLTTYTDKLKAVVGVNGTHVIHSFNKMQYRGQDLGHVEGDISTCKFMDGDKLIYRSYGESLAFRDSDLLPIHKSPEGTKFLGVSGEDDMSNPSALTYSLHAEQMRQAGRAEDFESLDYAGAGHLLEVPFQPFCHWSFHKLVGWLQNVTVKAEQSA